MRNAPTLGHNDDPSIGSHLNRIINVAVPDVGDFKDIPVIEVLVKPGDSVTKDSPLVVLESDKATLDVPSPATGVVGELLTAIGARVSMGTPLLTLHVSSESGSVEASSCEKDVTIASPNSASTVATGLQSPQMRASSLARTTPVPNKARHLPYASPSIRRMSRELGIDLTSVHGSGPRGRIVKEDVRAFVNAAAAGHQAEGARASNMPDLAMLPWPQVDFAKFGAVERAPLSKVRRIAGANLSRNSIVIPHVTNFEDADITDLEQFRLGLNRETMPPKARLTILPFLIKAAAATLAKFVAFNSSLDGDVLIIKKYCHIGFAIDTPDGLLVPVIRDVDRKSIIQIADEAAALAAQAREGKLKPSDTQGGCFTISSLGGIGGTGFTPIINAPEVAILGVVRARLQPVWIESKVVPRLILPMSLSWDHRAVDGVAAARFLAHLSALLADFRRVLL